MVLLNSPFVENSYTRKNYPICVEVRYNCAGSKTNFNLTSLLDIGAAVNLIDESIVSRFNLGPFVTSTSERVIGIESEPMKAWGEIKFDIDISGFVFPNCKFLILSGLPVSVLIGRSVIQSRLDELHFDFKKKHVRL